jgi:histidinol-phosphate/aromatic aminotransferase/cobyric acid decarboxylase-like protein
VLIDASVLGKESNEIRDRMAEKGIFIRPMSGHNMSKGFIRITVGTPEQNRLFIKVFGDYVKEVLGT